MATLGTAYVQIMPSAKGISGAISKELGGEATAAGKSAGFNVVGALKGVIAAAGLGAALKQALDAGGALQQSFGGLDTIYGEAAAGMKDLAYEAAKAGISANEYAEQAVSFGASLRQAFGGDMTKAAASANTAIMDMADNAAKMGSNVADIQHAYQGFAKQNYTMLDNLKLGYGGTKTEMERLLSDAEKLTGVKYDISNLGDVYEAIHVIQGELGITGVAAAEAEGTFTGSMAAMKAATQNFLANLALGEDIRPSLQIMAVSVRTFITKNMLPMIINILKGLPVLIEEGIGGIVDWLGLAGDMAGDLAGTAKEIVVGLANAIIKAAPQVATAAVELVKRLGAGIMDALPGMWETLKGFAKSMVESLKAALPSFRENGLQIIENIRNGLNERIKALPELLKDMGGGLMEAIKAVPWKDIGKTALDLLVAGVEGAASVIWTLLKTLGGMVWDYIKGVDWGGLADTVFEKVTEQGGKLLETGKALLGKVIDGVVAALPGIREAFDNFLKDAFDIFSAGLPSFRENGVQMIQKIKEGAQEMIVNVGTWLREGLPQVLADIGAILLDIGAHCIDILSHIDWIELGKTIIQLVMDGWAAMESIMWTALKEIGLTALDWFSSIDWLGLGMKVIELILSGLAAIGRKIWDKVKEIGQTAWDNFKNLDWLQLGTSLINNIVSGIAQLAGDIWSQLKGAADTAWQNFKDVDWWSLGSNIISGIVNGIASMGYKITNKLYDLAMGALDSVKRFLGIASPSKVFRDQVGRWIPEGIAEGIEANAKDVAAAMGDLAAETTASIDANMLIPDMAGVTPAKAVTYAPVINVYPSAGMDEKALANMVQNRMAFEARQAQAAWG